MSSFGCANWSTLLKTVGKTDFHIKITQKDKTWNQSDEILFNYLNSVKDHNNIALLLVQALALLETVENKYPFFIDAEQAQEYINRESLSVPWYLLLERLVWKKCILDYLFQTLIKTH